jgi:predicted secreted protein
VLTILGAIIFVVMLGAGCLGPEQQNPKENTSQAVCLESSLQDGNMIINETLNNATICGRLNSSLTIGLIDWSRLGGEWSVTTSPGVQVTDEGTIWYDENGTATTIPGLGRGIYTWNVTMHEAGLQTINATLQFPGIDRIGPKPPFNLTIVVG